jgi:flagellar biogenesis protein FliO
MALVPPLTALAAIFALLIAAVLLARRLRGPGWRAKPSQQIQLLAARPLGGLTTLVIVQAENQRYLIATGRHGTTAIGRLDRDG